MKLLYVNGCSHTAAAEAVIPAAFAHDDGKNGIDRSPHPTNLAASWCTHVAKAANLTLFCKAESGSSNTRIMRTTKEWIANNPHLIQDTFFIIQWTTWEREEWLHRGTYYQVNASGWDWVPPELQTQYKKFVVNVDWHKKTKQAHDEIWKFHQYLQQQNIPHLFFNGHSTFSELEQKYDWGLDYITPYDLDGSYHNWLIHNGGRYANPKTYHFDAESHRLWAQFMLQYLDSNQILGPEHAISFD